MPEKSARPSASLRMGFLRSEPTDRARGAIEFDFVSVAQPIEEPGNRDHRWNPELARDDSRVREQAASLDQKAARRGKQHDPTRGGVISDEDASRSQLRMLGIAHHASGPTHDPGAAPQAVSFLAVAFDCFARPVRTIRLRVIDGTPGLEALVRSRKILERLEFPLSNSRESAQIGGGCRAVVEGEYLAQFEIEDVARVVQAPQSREAPAGLEKEPTNGAKQSRALEAEILPIAHAFAGLAHDPEQGRAPKRRSGERGPHLFFGLTGRRDLRGRRHVRSGSGACDLADVPQQDQRILVESLAFQLPLFQATIAELRERRIVERGEFRILVDDADGRREGSFAQSNRKRGLRGSDLSHFANADRGLNADDVTLAADRVVREHAVDVAAPSFRELPKNAMEYHGEEIVDQRRVPPRKQLRLEFVIVRHEFVEAHILKRRLGRSQSLIQPDIEFRDLAVQRPVVFRQTE